MERTIGQNRSKKKKQRAAIRARITGIATTDHEDARGGGDVLANEGAEGGVALVPVEGTAFLNVTGVPVEGVAVVVRVTRRHVSVHA